MFVLCYVTTPSNWLYLPNTHMHPGTRRRRPIYQRKTHRWAPGITAHRQYHEGGGGSCMYSAVCASRPDQNPTTAVLNTTLITSEQTDQRITLRNSFYETRRTCPHHPSRQHASCGRLQKTNLQYHIERRPTTDFQSFLAQYFEVCSGAETLIRLPADSTCSGQARNRG